MRQACCDAQLVRKGLRRQALTASRLTASRLRCKSRMVSVATQAVRKTDPRRRMSPLELMGSRGTKRHHKANGCTKLRRSLSQNSLRRRRHGPCERLGSAGAAARFGSRDGGQLARRACMLPTLKSSGDVILLPRTSTCIATAVRAEKQWRFTFYCCFVAT